MIARRAAFGPAVGKPADYEFPAINEKGAATLSYVLWALTALAALATVVASLRYSALRRADGSVSRGMTLGARLSLGFGSMAVLILLVSALAAGAQKSGADSVDDLADSNACSTVISDLMTDTLMIRMKLKDFLLSNSDEDLRQYSDWAASAQAKLAWLQKRITDPKMVATLGELRTELTQYFETVAKVAEVVDRRNGTINSQINPTAKRMTDLLDAVLTTAHADGDLMVAYTAAEAESQLHQARVAFFKFLRSDSKEDAEAIAEHVAEARKVLTELAGEIENPRRKAWTLEAEQAFEFYGRQVRASEQLVEERMELVRGTLDKLGPEIRKTGQELVAEEHEADRAMLDRADARARTSTITSLTASGIAVTVAVIVALMLTSSITRAVGRVLTVLRAVADGDLTNQPLNMTGRDEMSELARATDRMSGSLTKLLNEVSGATRDVAGTATQIAASSEEMAGGMKEQTQQVTQISSAIEEMSASIVEVAKKSAEAAQNAGESGKTAEEGGRVVSQTISDMQEISQVVSASAASVTELGKRGQQIGQIIDVINDIADQTNLLALNAAIEAARAGEHGRGFAVVADEVRKLADRTTKATEEIASSIQAIQSETTTAVGKMTAGTEKVEQGVGRATEAGTSLEKIVAGSRTVADMVRSIAAAAEEQSAASEQVTRNIESINAVTRQASEGAGQAASAAAQLSSKAEQLQRLVGQFKLDESQRQAA